MSLTKRYFTVVIGSKETGRYISSSPSLAAKKLSPNSVLYINVKKLNFVSEKQHNLPKRKCMAHI